MSKFKKGDKVEAIDKNVYGAYQEWMQGEIGTVVSTSGDIVSINFLDTPLNPGNTHYGFAFLEKDLILYDNNSINGLCDDNSINDLFDGILEEMYDG